MKRTKDISGILIKGILILLLFAAPAPAAGLHYLPEGCFGQVTGDQVVVYYFTRKFRCQSCQTLENTILKTVRERYSQPFSSGRLAMCVINVDAPANRHFLEEFEILSTSVYIVEKAGGQVVRSENLDGIWDVLDDAQAITSLIVKGLDNYLDGTDPGLYSKPGEDKGRESDSATSGDRSSSGREGTKPKNRSSEPESKAAGPGNQSRP